MTLLISAINPRFVILLADRRITTGGKVLEDGYNKLTVLCCQDARVAIAFTGLAKAGAFDTTEWIMSYLDKVAAPDDWLDKILEGMRSEVESEFKRRKLVGRGLAIMASGFVHVEGTAKPVARTISNFDECGNAGDSFRAVSTVVEDGVGTVLVAGWTSAVSKDARLALEAVSTSLADPRHAVRKAVMTLQRAADSGRAMRTIGKYCNSAVIEYSPDKPIVATYHTPNAEQVVCGPNIVITGKMCSFGVKMRGADALAGPEINKRAHCWCGSGLFFKYCHRIKFGSVYARSPHFKTPLTWFQRVEFPVARPSGKIVCIKGGFE